MRKAAVAFGLALAAIVGPVFAQAPPPPPQEVVDTIADPFDGLTYRRFERGGEAPMVAHVLQVDLTQPGVRFTITPGDRSGGMEHRAQLTTAFLASSKAAAAVNASYFLPFVGGSAGGEDYYPKAGDPVGVSGAALLQGRTVSPIEIDRDLRVNAMVCFRAAKVAIADGQKCPGGWATGIAAGPRLLAKGAMAPLDRFDAPYAFNRHPRTAIGVSGDGRTAWIVVIDGRQPEYSLGASLPELTALFSALGAADAINLDGGGSSALALRDGAGAAALINRPIHTGVPGRERPVANHIAIYAPPRGE